MTTADNPTPIRTNNSALFVDQDTINDFLERKLTVSTGDPAEDAAWRRKPTAISPKMWDYEPVGSRLYVYCYPSPPNYGLIYIPEEVNEQSGVGIVVAVGDAIGHDLVQYPGGTEHDNPSDLLYKEVIFSAHVGKPLRLDFIQDSHYSAAVLVMTSRDLWAVNWADLTIPHLGLAS